jgi:signal transduction histidine kinase
MSDAVATQQSEQEQGAVECLPAAEPAPPKIIVIDDDNAICLACRKILLKEGSQVQAFEDGLRGLEAITSWKPDLVVVDLKMPGIGGMEVLSRVHEFDPHIIIVVITGYATIDTAVQAMKCGAYDFLPKPFAPDPLRLIVRRGLEHRRLVIESRRHEMERELIKRRFVSFISHQLQSPLAAVHQYLDVLRHLEDTPETAAKRREWLERCSKRIGELEELIRDWLTLAKAEERVLVAQRCPIDVRPILEGILNSYEQMALAEGIRLEARLPEQACMVWGNRHCLNVLFDNLIVNAIKYNRPGGGVTVSAQLLGDGQVAISVSDTGVGIPEKYRRFLFEEFFRIPREGGEAKPGTGLGLAICRKIVSEMGGSIEVASEVGAGTTFCVRLLSPPETAGSRETQVEQTA